MPVIPGVNDKRGIVSGIADQLIELEKREITLLRYNKLWESKIPRIHTTQK